MNKFYKDLKAGLEEAIAYKKGKIYLRSEIIEIPKPQEQNILLTARNKTGK